MTRSAISVDTLGKRYRLLTTRSTSLREAISEAGVRLFRRAPDDPAAKSFWALRDVSFNVGEGEIVGIVGNNGAGKSTLLKILSRITPPTEGSVRLRGRVGSLLEVGTGFHPELSGRDNIFMNGVLLGMERREIRRRFDEIVAFAEVEKFIELPVKRYSSGMYLRLAFAVAAHLETDILLIDEVLAVGDIAFQKKCMARMDEVAHAGRTILFVSHNLTAVQALCPRTIWIDHGGLLADGETRDVLTRYLKSANTTGSANERQWPGDDGPSAGNIRLRRAVVRPAGGMPSDPIDVTAAIEVEFDMFVARPTAAATAGFQLINDQGLLVFDTGPEEGPVTWRQGFHRLRATIPGDLLNAGSYRVTLFLYRDGNAELQMPEVLVFDVLDSPDNRHGWYGTWPGAIRPHLAWTHEAEAVGPA
ncbi:MAG: polysaccharide ABC transporter ATP-binding protein [Sphingomicrobium sp.]